MVFCCSLTQSSPTLCDPIHYNTPGFFVLHHLLELAKIHVHQISDAIPTSGSFSNELALCNRWPNYWSFSISPSNEYSGLISFRTNWLDLLAAQGTLKSLLQHHSSKASVLRCSAFIMLQLSCIHT